MKRDVFLFLILVLGMIPAVFAQDTIPVSTSRGYLLGPGDQIATKVLGEDQFDFEASVDENGNIEVPFFDKPITAMCKSERELRFEVTQLLSKYLRSPQVSLRITERKSRPPTTIYGEVRSPQQVILMRQARLLELLSVAGGVTDDAGGVIQVFRPQAPMCGSPEEIAEWNAQNNNIEGIPMRLYTLSSVRRGDESANPVIFPGDIISVEKAKPVYIVGEVKGGQGGLYIKEGGLRLSNAIAMVGGVNREAKTKDVKIYRQKPDSIEKDIITVNLDLIKSGKQPDVMLEAYDVIEVDKAKDSIAKTLLKVIAGAGSGGISSLITGGATRVLY